MSDVVTLDLGNSRLKLRRWSLRVGTRPELVGGATFRPTVDALCESAAALFEDRTIGRVALSSVAAPETEDAVAGVLARGFGARFEPRIEPRLSIETRLPERVGRDRLFAARGAWALSRAAAIVIDAGTCVTVDALAPPAGLGSEPRFLGGAIAPGPELLADALARGGARLARVEPRPGAHALGRDTEEALRAGIVVGLRGAVRELVLALERESGLEDPRLHWTGGARAYLCAPPLFAERPGCEEPDLVHFGMLSALGHEWPQDRCVAS